MATLLQLRQKWAKQDADQRAQKCAEIERQLKTWGIQEGRDGWHVVRSQESASVWVMHPELPVRVTLKLNDDIEYGGIRGCPVVIILPNGREDRWINSARDLVRGMEK